jgi:hypothetical protein
LLFLDDLGVRERFSRNFSPSAPQFEALEFFTTAAPSAAGDAV